MMEFLNAAYKVSFCFLVSFFIILPPPKKKTIFLFYLNFYGVWVMMEVGVVDCGCMVMM